MATRRGGNGSDARRAWVLLVCLITAAAVTATLPMSGSSSYDGESRPGDLIPHALFGFVHGIFGEKLDAVAQVTLRNNRTGATMATVTDPSAADYSYRFDDIGGMAVAGDHLTLQASFGDLSAVNWTVVVLAYPYQTCDLWLWGEESFSEIPVRAGWNLVSTPFLARNRGVASVFADEECEWTRVMRYQAEPSGGRWVSYDASAPAFMNSLRSVMPGEGVWLYVADPGDGMISVNGLLLASLDVGLVKGWNMAGYPSLQRQSVASSLVGVSYDLIQNYSSTAAYNLRVMLETNQLTAGGAYWIHASSDCVWTVFNAGGVSCTLPESLDSNPPDSPRALSDTGNGTATLYAGQAHPGIAFPAQLDVPLVNLTIVNENAWDDELRTVDVEWSGTDPSDAAAVSLWLDADADLFAGPGDTMLASTPLSSGAASFDLSLAIPALDRVNLLIACDLSVSAVPGHALDARLPVGGVNLHDAGYTTESLDPAGSTTVASSLHAPHYVYGHVYTPASAPLAGVTVSVTNQRTGQTLDNVTDADGKYLVDIGSIPGGYVLGDVMDVDADDGALLTGHNQTLVTDSFGDRCDIWTIEGGPVEGAPYIRIHKQTPDLNITWAPLANATSYVVYRSLAVDGTGFDWNVSLAEVSTCCFVDAGALADSNNYSYVVVGKSAQGEGPRSNIGWKLRKLLVKNPAISSLNWIALPYETDIADAVGLVADIGGSAYVSSTAIWLPSTQSYQTKLIPFGGTNWLNRPGMGILLNMKLTTVYTIVGSHNDSVTVDLAKNALISSLNWIALPYHTTMASANDLIASVGGSAYISSAARWVPSSQSYQTKLVPFGGTNWIVLPGEASLLNMKIQVDDYNLGPVRDP